MAGYNNTGTPKTLCWDCKNCVPSREKNQGCEWSLRFEPVPGWDAVKHNLRVNAEHTVISYRVISCPRYDKMVRHPTKD